MFFKLKAMLITLSSRAGNAATLLIYSFPLHACPLHHRLATPTTTSLVLQWNILQSFCVFPHLDQWVAALTHKYFSQLPTRCTLLQGFAIGNLNIANGRANKAVDLLSAACWPTTGTVQRAETVVGARGAQFHWTCWSICDWMKLGHLVNASCINGVNFCSTALTKRTGPSPDSLWTTQKDVSAHNLGAVLASEYLQPQVRIGHSKTCNVSSSGNTRQATLGVAFRFPIAISPKRCLLCLLRGKEGSFFPFLY